MKGVRKLKQYTADCIKNIALAGHGSSGKTSLAEALLFTAGASERLGKIVEGNTVCDFDPEETKRKISIATSVAPLEWKGEKINLLDTPGLFDFAEGLYEGIRAAGSVIINISGKSGVAVGTEKAFQAARERGLPVIFFVNKLDSDHADFYKVFEQLKTQFGPAVCPMVVPFVVEHRVQCYVNVLEYRAYEYKDGKASGVAMPDMGARLEGLRTAINEAVAETSDEMFEKYFSGESFTPEEMITGVSAGVRNGSIYPVFCGSSQSLQAIDQLLQGISWLAPSAAYRTEEIGEDENGELVELKADPDQPAAVIVFKTVADPFVGKLSYVKVVSGKITPEMQLINMRTGNAEKVGKLLMIRGKKQEECQEISAGDIGAIAKMQTLNTGDTLCAPARKIVLQPVENPKPSLSMAVLPLKKGDEEKIAQGIARLAEEDPSIHFENNTETHQMLLSGLGEQHLDIIASKLKSKFGVEVRLVRPKVAYRETIRKKVQVQGRHKKQTGGHGQFGDVWIEFEPCDSESMEFGERVVGGAVPKGFFPAVEKGLRECILKGTLAGYPMVGLKATLYDGSYHPVDSSEMSFKMAAALAYKAGIPMANPVLLEPISSMRILVPNDDMGDVIGEINKRRGRVLGMNPMENGQQEIVAEAPMAEIYDFSNFLRQCTQGRGSFETSFERYEETPPQVAAKVIEEAKQAGEVE